MILAATIIGRHLEAEVADRRLGERDTLETEVLEAIFCRPDGTGELTLLNSDASHDLRCVQFPIRPTVATVLTQVLKKSVIFFYIVNPDTTRKFPIFIIFTE